MITHAEIEKLGAMHAVEPTCFRSTWHVPPRARGAVAACPPGRDELIAAAERGLRRTGRLRERGPELGPGAAGARARRDWPGRTVAIFACADAGLLEAYPAARPAAGAGGAGHQAAYPAAAGRPGAMSGPDRVRDWRRRVIAPDRHRPRLASSLPRRPSAVGLPPAWPRSTPGPCKT